MESLVSAETPILDARAEAEVTSQVETLVQAYTRADERMRPWLAPTSNDALDPGATLIRVFSRFTSHVLSRLNQAPERHREAFLALTGTRRQAPRAARVPLHFTPVTGRSSLRQELPPTEIPKGTRVFPPARQELVFETTEALTLLRTPLDSVLVVDPSSDLYSDRSAFLARNSADQSAEGALSPAAQDSFSAFEGELPLTHSLYLAAQGVLNHPDASQLTLMLQSALASDLWTLPLEYAVFDGQYWQPLTRSFGILEGLAVTLPSSGTVCTVSAGRALDGVGRTLQCLTDQSVDLSVVLVEALSTQTTVVLLLIQWTPGEPRFLAVPESSASQYPPETFVRLARVLVTNGGQMSGFRMASTETLSGQKLTLQVSLPPGRIPCDVNGIVDCWLRIRPALPNRARSGGFALTGLNLSALVSRQSLAPSLMRMNAAVLDPASDFRPFGEHPVPGDQLYLLQDEALSQMPGTRVEVSVVLSERLSPADVRASTDLVLSWESWDGKQWRELGRSTPTNPNLTNVSGFSDDSKAFTSYTSVSNLLQASARFLVQNWMQPLLLGNQSGRVVRVRILKGNYGLSSRTEQVVVTPSDSNASYYNLLPENAQGQKIQMRWIDATFAPPILKALSFAYDTSAASPVLPSRCLTEDDFQWRDLSEKARSSTLAQAPLTILEANAGNSPDDAGSASTRPSLYLGFEQVLPNQNISLYFQVQPGQSGLSPASSTGGEPRLEWSYLSTSGWKGLSVEDETRALRSRGLVRFVGPEDGALGRVAGKLKAWLRITWEAGSYAEPPRLMQISPNTVWVENSQVRQEVLGSGTEQAGLTLKTSATPVLEGARLEIDEKGNGLWLPWTEVTDFYRSGADDRHFRLNALTGQLQFGDGRQGRLPPRGTNNIRISYRFGGGAAGNVPAGSLTQLARPVPFVAQISHSEPGVGGADPETSSAFFRRGAASLRHQGRAVTASDFEDLSRELLPDLARVYARTPLFDPISLPETHESNADAGKVVVVIVPNSPQPRPIPETGLLQWLEEALRARSLTGVEIVCQAPQWVSVSVDALIVPDSEAVAGRARYQALQAIQRFLHPLTGGPDGNGWPFGALPHQSDLHSLLTSVPGIRSLRALSLRFSGAIPFPEGPLTDAQIEAQSETYRQALRTALVVSGEHSLRLGAA